MDARKVRYVKAFSVIPGIVLVATRGGELVLGETTWEVLVALSAGVLMTLFGALHCAYLFSGKLSE
ncbi:hypothetical protein CEP50_06410 [Actinopolyspora mortivallis]|uniref:Uncharacterized protein n=1 Tax=Actinopolyspora mortivallis TaxID=33906 RepID=A0A2T0GYS7_ACTMO|nr:hypothetical protein CEP50_06410 [Actinopolyspora mortivallis]